MHYLVLCCCYFPCGLKILFLYTWVVNITQKLYNKMHLNAVLALIFFFKDFVYLGIVTSRKMLFSCYLLPVCHVLKILF